MKEQTKKKTFLKENYEVTYLRVVYRAKLSFMLNTVLKMRK